MCLLCKDKTIDQRQKKKRKEKKKRKKEKKRKREKKKKEEEEGKEERPPTFLRARCRGQSCSVRCETSNADCVPEARPSFPGKKRRQK